jgi:glycosyltransferase involved in cell wall biosynthesis
VQSERSDPASLRLLWYVAGTLKMAGGGERLIMEGLRQFECKGLKTALLLGSSMPNQAALFDGTYIPPIQILAGQVSEQSDTSPNLLQKAIRRIRRELRLALSLSKAVLLSASTVVVANSEEECRILWLAGLLSVRKLPVHLTFVHGSRFQFAEDITKYSLVFRRHFNQIRNADHVYTEMIPAGPPAIPLTRRLRIEWTSLLDYLGLRLSRYVVVHSQKNQREVELLYNHRNVVVVPAGGFSRAEFAYHCGRDMRTAFQLSNRTVVLSVCRLVPKKRVDQTIRAFAEMVRDHPETDSILVVAGTGPELDNLRNLSRNLQIERQVKFIGFIPESQLKDWYCSCDLFVSTDNADYDLSVMMALPLACKVLVTKQYSFPDCLDRMRRYINVAEPSVQSLAETMHEAIQSVPAPVNAADLAELDNLTWERYFETILSLGKQSLGNEVTNSTAERR